MWREILAAALGLAATSVQARGDLPPPLPTYTGAYQPQGVDERGIWMLADEDERRLRDSQAVIGDAALNGYVRDVLCRTIGADRCGSVRIYILRQAAFNAWMTPNGTMVVHTGLLLRARDEAELAAVLGHEFAHFELRHSLASYRKRRGAGDIVAWAGVLASGAGTYAGVRTYQSIRTGALGGVAAYGRDQERQADLLSMAYVGASPYDPRCFADLLGRVLDEADATAQGRRQQSTRYDRVAFFASHPTTLERTGYLRAVATDMGKTGVDEGERYRAAMMTWRPQFLADQMKLNEFEGTDYLLGRLAGDRWPADLLFARGELYRARGNPRDLVAAVGFYLAAIAQDPGNADAYRGLGLAQMRSRDPAAAASLRTYLKMRPDAADGAMIETLLP